MDSKELFDLAERLDSQIESKEKSIMQSAKKTYNDLCELSDLKAYREHIQNAIEDMISAMEIDGC